MKERHLIFAANTFLAALVAIYLSGYWWLCDNSVVVNGGTLNLRSYPARWLAVIYRPVAYLQGLCERRAVETNCLLREED